jgi:hypothetical protein
VIDCRSASASSVQLAPGTKNFMIGALAYVACERIAANHFRPLGGNT